MSDTGLWLFIRQALAEQRPVALAIVAAARGSVPARAGCKMAVTPDAEYGTVGGGLIEEAMLRQARKMLNDHEQKPWTQDFSDPIHSDEIDDGLWCGGRTTVLIYPFQPTDSNAVKCFLVAGQNRKVVTFRLDNAGLAIDNGSLLDERPSLTDGANWQYRETLRPPKRAYIVGAGHCGQALAQLLRWLAFEVVLLDCREMRGSASVEGYQPWQVVNYRTIDQFIPGGDDCFVFVMTHRHVLDQDVIACLAEKSFAYLGLLGSQNKVNRIKAALSSHVDAEHLERLRAPMGLPIASHTPHEIAISIAADVLGMINSANVMSRGGDRDRDC